MSILLCGTAFIGMFEKHLYENRRGSGSLSYTVPDLVKFIDSFYDVSALTFVLFFFFL